MLKQLIFEDKEFISIVKRYYDIEVKYFQLIIQEF